jgi:WD40 repeat protein
MRTTFECRHARLILGFASAFLFLFLVATTRAQNPQSTPPDKRDLGLQSNAAANSQSDKTKSKEARPELVLQTGYNNFFGATRLGFSPDGRLLATASFRTNTIKLWETATGRELRDLSTSGQNTTSLSPVFAFSPDSRWLAAAGGSNSVKVWDLTNGHEAQTLTGAQASFMGALGVTYIAFSADGKKLVTISDSIRVWDTTTWRETVTVENAALSASGFAGGEGGVALNPDGSQLARLTNDQIKFIDLGQGREVRSVSLPDPDLENAELCFTADGHLLVAGILKKNLKVWDLSSKAERVSAPTLKEFSFIKFSSDGRLIALCENYTIKIWETATGRELPAINVPNTGVFLETGGVFVNFSHDGKKLASGGFGTQTLVWDTESGKQIQQMKGRTNLAYAVAFSADGNQLTSGGRTRWDLRTGQGRRLSGTTSDRLFGMPSPDGKLIATFAPNISTVTILDAINGRTLQTLTRPNVTDGVEKVYFSPDGHLLAVSYLESQGARMIGRPPSSQLKIWNVNSGSEIQALTLSTPPVELGFSSDGRVLATVSSQGEITLWDVASGSRLRSLSTSSAQSANPFPNFGNLPDPRKMKPGQMPQMPNMADMTAMMTNVLGTMTAGTMGRSVTSVSFSPDGKVLASGGVESKSNLDMAAMMGAASGNQKRSKNQKPPSAEDFLKDLKVETTGQIVLWNAGTGQQIGTIKGHGKGITDVAFSRDSKMIASAGTDNTIKLWEVGTQRELRTLNGHTANIESMDFSPDGKLLASASDDGSTFLWDTTTGEHLLTLISLDDGGEWMVVTPEGLFDGTPQSWNQILWRYNQDTFNVAPVEWFFNEFYYPGLLAEVFAGKRPHVAQDVSKKDRRQPIVKLTPSGNVSTDNISSRTVQIKIDVTDAAADKDHSQGSGARDLRLFRNGSLVKVWHGDALKGQSVTSFEENLTVVAGPNRLTAYAFNNDNVKSKDANLVLTGADSLKRAGTVWVIAVGVNEYANAQYNLKYAVADAQSFAEALSREQKAVRRFDHVEVLPLLNDQATKENILAALRRLSGTPDAPTLKAGPLDRIKRAEPEDAVIIYFAGHGTAQGQRFYLIPHDLGYAGDRGALDESGLKAILAHSISDQQLEDAVEGLAAESMLMVIDACNSGQALEAEEKRRGPMNSKGLAQLAYEKGMYILTAAQSYQAALEAAQFGHGLLTYALVEEGLKTAAADNEPKDGVVSAREWLDFATERVPLMQEEKMKEGRALGLNIAFTEGEQKIVDPEKRSVQRPRVFYRREMEASPLLVAKPAP